MAPSKAPEKKGKKKELPEAREGLRRRGLLDTKSGDTAAPSAQDGNEEEDEEESASSHSKKRASSGDVEEEQPPRAQKRQCRPKLNLRQFGLRRGVCGIRESSGEGNQGQAPCCQVRILVFVVALFSIVPYSWKLIV